MNRKQKKTGQSETILLEPTKDILGQISAKRQRQIVIGFCAETENLLQNAQTKLEKKRLDFIVGNLVSAAHDPFQGDQNEVLVLDRLGGNKTFTLAGKRQIASQLWDYIVERTTAFEKQPATAGTI